jgi:hypothetical protein
MTLYEPQGDGRPRLRTTLVTVDNRVVGAIWKAVSGRWEIGRLAGRWWEAVGRRWCKVEKGSDKGQRLQGRWAREVEGEEREARRNFRLLGGYG